MYNDILGDKGKKVIQDKDAIIEALKYNLSKKEKLIKDLIKQITELERELENVGTI